MTSSLLFSTFLLYHRELLADSKELKDEFIFFLYSLGSQDILFWFLFQLIFYWLHRQQSHVWRRWVFFQRQRSLRQRQGLQVVSWYSPWETEKIILETLSRHKHQQNSNLLAFQNPRLQPSCFSGQNQVSPFLILVVSQVISISFL